MSMIRVPAISFAKSQHATSPGSISRLRGARNLARIEHAVEQHRALDAPVEGGPVGRPPRRADQHVWPGGRQWPVVACSSPQVRRRSAQPRKRGCWPTVIVDVAASHVIQTRAHAPSAKPRPVEILLSAPSRRRSRRTRFHLRRLARANPHTAVAKTRSGSGGCAGNARRADCGDHCQGPEPLEGGAEIGHAVGAGRDRLRLGRAQSRARWHPPAPCECQARRG